MYTKQIIQNVGKKTFAQITILYTFKYCKTDTHIRHTADIQMTTHVK